MGVVGRKDEYFTKCPPSVILWCTSVDNQKMNAMKQVKHEIHDVTLGLRKITHYMEGLTSLMAGTYVLSLAVTKRNLALRIALGVAAGYLVLRSGSKLRAGSLGEDIL